VNKQIYTKILRRLRDMAGRKHLEKWGNNSWFLFHDNAPAHRSVLVTGFLAKNNETKLEYTPYSPDQDSGDIYLFARMKSAWKGGTSVILRTSLRMRRMSWKGFHRIASRNVSNTFTVA